MYILERNGIQPILHVIVGVCVCVFNRWGIDQNCNVKEEADDRPFEV